MRRLFKVSQGGLIILSLSLLLSGGLLSVFAEEAPREWEEEPYRFPDIVKKIELPEHLTLEFTQIEAVMRQASPVLMNTAANREVVQYNRNQLGQQQDAARHALYNLGVAMGGISQMTSGLDAAFAAAAAAGAAPTLTDMVLKSAVEGQLTSTISQLTSQAQSLATADKGYVAGGNLSATVAQLDEASLQIIYGAYSLHHGYLYATRQIGRLQEELVLLQRQMQVVTLLEELGLTAAYNKQSLQNGIQAMEQGIRLAQLEQGNLLIELNLLLGRSAEASLELAPIPLPDLQVVKDLDFPQVWATVYQGSYLLKGKGYSQAGLQDQYDDVVWMYGEFGDRAWRAEQQLEGAKLDTTMSEAQLRSRLATLIDKMQHNVAGYHLEQSKLESAYATWQRSELSYSLGYLSENDLLQQRNAYAQQAAVVAQASDDLGLAWQRYLLICRGMDIGR
ncbi:MAG: hypothetical protein FWF06_06215 [Symbiobacteriaceae bacterium]|nr:hypothetical protein [Symbiobacteriaceae bacterium]